MIAQAMRDVGLEVFSHGHLISGIFWCDNGVDFQVVTVQTDNGYFIKFSNWEDFEFEESLQEVLNIIKGEI